MLLAHDGPASAAQSIRSRRQVMASRTTRAGVPATRQFGGIVPLTIEPSPTMQACPIRAPFSTVALAPSQT